MNNKDIPTGSWRTINLCKAPFNFPEPCLSITENCSEENNFQMDLENVAQEVWEKCQLLVLCSPSNPTGKVMTKDEHCKVVNLSKEIGFKVWTLGTS